ncbi:unnamed protein product [Ilex paraguariensis]|uniref:Fe2OG dioxygenase domain-containing protein n=1 Tax=Ilex paraguariensis TaxID=185542 RepID=A0ABC8V0Y8_9AQUA
MATTAPTQFAMPTSNVQPSNVTSVKTLTETADLKTIPSIYAYTPTNPNEADVFEDEVSIPIIDFSLLTSAIPEQRSKAIQDLDKACQDWGFFMVVNHGVPESLLKGIISASNEFFNLTEEEKKEFAGKNILDPIRCGTSLSTSNGKIFLWRDFVKLVVQPDQFHAPHKPIGFSEVALEYCNSGRRIVRELLKAISESLGLDNDYVEKTLNLDSSAQVFSANLYPPCPQPELAMGLPPHSDHGLFTLLIQNDVPGLQVQHNGKWVTINPLPNSFLVNTADQLEIFSNGKYKTLMHRAILNNKVARISIAMANGPSFEATVGPASKLVDSENHPAAYRPMNYKEYVEQQQLQSLGKTILDHVRIEGQSK